MFEGPKYLYTGATDEQVNWGGNDDPRQHLRIGSTYTLLRKEEHTWHTKFTLAEFPKLKFNSVSFEEVKLLETPGPTL